MCVRLLFTAVFFVIFRADVQQQKIQLANQLEQQKVELANVQRDAAQMQDNLKDVIEAQKARIVQLKAVSTRRKRKRRRRKEKDVVMLGSL